MLRIRFTSFKSSPTEESYAFAAFKKVCTSQVRKNFHDVSENIIPSALLVFIVCGIRRASNIYRSMPVISTYGHRLKNNQHPVRSAKDKFQIDQLVVGWVTTSEYWLLYVFEPFLFAEAESESRAPGDTLELIARAMELVSPWSRESALGCVPYRAGP